MVIPRNNLCLVCHKAIGNARNSLSSEGCHRFSVLASRFLNLQSGNFSLGTLGSGKGKTTVSYHVCEHCLPLVESFNQIYEQWHFLKIQLNWKATELSEVMQMSDTESASIRRGNSNVSRFRKEFMQKAIQRSTTSFPKLTIEALSQDAIDTAVNRPRNFGNGNRETSPRSDDEEPIAGHRCPHCSIVLYSSHFYELHLTQHADLKKSHRRRKCASMYEYAGVTGSVKVEKIEQPEKLHECSYCQKRFTIRINLQNHELIHTGEKPYVCRFCLKNFRQRGHLVTHYNRIHKDKAEMPLLPKDENENQNVQSHGSSEVEQGKPEPASQSQSRPAKRIKKAKSVVETTGNETKGKRAKKRPGVGPWSAFAATEMYYDGFEDASAKRNISGD